MVGSSPRRKGSIVKHGYALNVGVTDVDDLEFGTHDLGGVHAVTLYPNGYGASIVGGARGLYGDGRNTFEVAVLRYENFDDPHSWSLTYDTPITDDVLSRVPRSNVTQVLHEIAAL